MGDIKFITVPGKKALAELDRLRAAYPATGLYPILLGDANDYARIRDDLDGRFDPAATLEASEALEPSGWLRERAEADPELFQDEIGEWPDPAPEPLGIITHLDVLSRKPMKEVVIGLLAVTSPWQAFAHLNWGGWNDCPCPVEHCAMHRYWAERYGAEVVSVTEDVVQCVVSRPPADREASIRLAHEQYVYCYDIVAQGTGSVAALGAGLLDADYWYFWWD